MANTLVPDAARALTTSPEAFRDRCRLDLDRAREEIARLHGMPAGQRGDGALVAYDAAIGALSDAGSRCSLARSAHPMKEMREAAEACEQEVEALGTELSQDRKVYDALAGIDLGAAPPSTRHYVEKTLRDFRRAGVDRDEATRATVRSLRDELIKIGQQFGKNIIEDVRSVELEPAALDGLPEDYRRAHPPGPNGKVRLTTDNTDFQPFITYAKSEAARETLWRLYRLRGHPANLEVLSRMLEKRHALATLLGYASWADYATEDKMIGTGQAAADFIARIADASGGRCEEDYAQLLARKQADDPKATRVEGWDSAYLQERVKAEQYGFDAQQARPYFEYARVQQGVLDVTGRLFGIRYVRVPDAPLWHPDVQSFDVFEEAERIGRIYLDMHPREGKYKHYAQFTVINGVKGKQLPEGALLCNFPRPGADGSPALMEHGEVRTFFHEFGHLLHHVLGGHTRWAGVSGVATEWDFVEAPSQMLEEWIFDPETMRTFALHIETDEPIPAELLRRAQVADEYGKGLWVRQQMFYAALSLELHRRDPRGLDTTATVAELQARYTPFRFVDGTYMQTSFGHLDGYSAAYYTYMWSLVIAKDLFSVFRQQGLLNPLPARRYRKEILEPGGSRPAAELVENFLGRPYAFGAYESWLNAR